MPGELWLKGAQNYDVNRLGDGRGKPMTMDDHQYRNIYVKPSTLSNIAADVTRVRYRISQFQFEYVWTRTKVWEVFDCIYHE